MPTPAGIYPSVIYLGGPMEVRLAVFQYKSLGEGGLKMDWLSADNAVDTSTVFFLPPNWYVIPVRRC